LTRLGFAGFSEEASSWQVRWEPIGHEDIAQAQKGEANSAALDYLQAKSWSHVL